MPTEKRSIRHGLRPRPKYLVFAVVGTMMAYVVGHNERFLIDGAAPIGLYIQYFEERMGFARSFTIAAAVDAILLMSTTAIGLVFILKGKVQQHRQWMTRSYAVALVFFEVRLISGVLGLDDAGPAVAELIVWICLAFSIPLADLALQIQDSWPGRSTRVKSRPAPV